jgi:ketosteroid isomerase-like protein
LPVCQIPTREPVERRDNPDVPESNAEIIRRGFEAASRGDIDAIAALLDKDVYWGAPGGGGCENRKQTLRWMSEGIARGVNVEVVDTRELPDGRVLVVLQRTGPPDGESEPPEPHAQLVSFRDGKVTEMLVYPTPDEALGAAGAV